MALRRMPQPVLAAVNGVAYGGGMCLSLAAELRIAGESAEFNATGIVNGLTRTELGARRLLPEVLELAASMAEFSPYGLQMTKEIIWVNLENPSLQSAIEIEDRNQLMLGFTENLPEAIRAFDERRAPRYTDAPRRDLFS